MNAFEDSRGYEPPALQRRPILSDFAKPIGDAFIILSSTRTYGMEVNPISLSEINSYLQLFGSLWLDDEQFIALILQIDRHYLSEIKRKRSNA